MPVSVIDALGVVGTALTIVGFLQSNIPDAPPEGATIRIKAGLSGDDEAQIDGQIAAAYAWDIENNYLGKSGGAHLETGDVADLTIDQFSPGTRGEYIGIAAAKDAVCIAWITVTMFDRTDGGSWTGDVGYECGQDWYEQKERAGWVDEEQTKEYIPRCTWLDEDHSNGIESAALKFSSTAYGEKVVETKDKAKHCDFTLWGPDNGPINGKPGKRSMRQRLPWMEESLVVSNITQHKAKNLCSSDTSWGPDFVGTDGMFCDMATKTLMPLCSTDDIDGCVDIDDQVKTVKRRSIMAGRAVRTTHRAYKKIDHWD